MNKRSSLLVLTLVMLVAAYCCAPPVMAQSKGMAGPFPRPSENDPYVLLLSSDTRLDCRGTFQRVEQLREEVQENSQRQPALDAAINEARVCLDNGIEPPDGSSLVLSSEDFEKAKKGAEAKSRKKLEDKKKEKGELPDTGGTDGAALLALGTGVFVIGGLLACRVIR